MKWKLLAESKKFCANLFLKYGGHAATLLVHFIFRGAWFCANLIFKAIDRKFLHVVDSFIAYNLWQFQIDSPKIDAWATHETENLLKFQSYYAN